jgi:hypothetical protein
VERKTEREGKTEIYIERERGRGRERENNRTIKTN